MDDAQNTANDAPPRDPSAESQHSGADIFAGLLAARGHVALSAANYSLGSLDFGAPAAHEVTPLKVEKSYSLGPLEIGVPEWRWGEYVIHWHDAGCDPVGRPSDIPADKAPELIAATRGYLTKRRITDLKRMTRADRAALYDFVRELVENEGIQTSDRILREQIIGPALQEKR